VRTGRTYVDVGTLRGYRDAIGLLGGVDEIGDAEAARMAVGWPAGRSLAGRPLMR
jgi:glucose-1-phosphate thymidylyltransferase